MKNRKILITDKNWFEHGALRNPICSLDHELEKYDPSLYCLHYDTRLLAVNPPTRAEKESVIYNDYREQFGTQNLKALDTEIRKTGAKNLFLNGFNQDLFEYIVPMVKDTVEIIYFFKCPKISDLSALSQFSKLKCIQIFQNNSLSKLWDMKKAENLKVLSFSAVTKLSSIEVLKHSFVEYVHFDSTDNNGQQKPMLFDASVFDQIPHLKQMSLAFKNCEIKKTW